MTPLLELVLKRQSRRLMGEKQLCQQGAVSGSIRLFRYSGVLSVSECLCLLKLK